MSLLFLSRLFPLESGQVQPFPRLRQSVLTRATSSPKGSSISSLRTCKRLACSNARLRFSTRESSNQWLVMPQSPQIRFGSSATAQGMYSAINLHVVGACSVAARSVALPCRSSSFDVVSRIRTPKSAIALLPESRNRVIAALKLASFGVPLQRDNNHLRSWEIKLRLDASVLSWCFYRFGRSLPWVGHLSRTRFSPHPAPVKPLRL